MSTNKQIKLVEKEVVVEYKCDCCKGLIVAEHIPNSWHHFSAGHGDWGNDSIESFENYDVCSYDCYIQKVKECFESLKARHEATIDDKDISFWKTFFKQNELPKVDWREIFIKVVEYFGDIEGISYGAENGGFSFITVEEKDAILQIKESEYLKYRK